MIALYYRKTAICARTKKLLIPESANPHGKRDTTVQKVKMGKNYSK